MGLDGDFRKKSLLESPRGVSSLIGRQVDVVMRLRRRTRSMAGNEDNGNDCGIFVMKYMEASLGKDRVDWTRHTSWAKEMPRIRAEIVATLLQTFQTSLLTENGFCV
ncbi:hypothetical protein KSP39_PZI002492 [Platanthera zijinensis]|uniref:Ubiquitin-like protease family profile domain-containing protein n=1 Tax=Platanthera zijinensis TaxID=2320716 RepID=A0AAP0BZF2_9ASPA